MVTADSKKRGTGELPDTMRGLWLEDQSVRFRDDLERPRPAPGEALIRVVRAGLCNTDLELVRGYYPYCGIPGHEFVGVVEQGSAAWLGQRVVGEINIVCHQCSSCRQGRSNHCERRTVLGIVGRNGAFAEYLCLPEANLHRVPDSLDTDAACFTEPLAAALEIQQQVAVSPATRALVVGDGKLGLLIAQTLALTGSEVVAVGRHASKLALLERRGVETHVSESWSQREAGQARRFDLAVECTGSSGGFEVARRALRPRGTLVLKSTYRGELVVDASAVVVDELTLIGSRCGPFTPALRRLEREQIDVATMVHDRFPLERGVRAFERAAEPGVLKVLIDIAPEAPDAGKTRRGRTRGR